MLDAHINNKANVYSTMPNSKARFESSALYIAENGTLPEPIVGFELKEGLSILDGNHRMTALCYCEATVDELFGKRRGYSGEKPQDLDGIAPPW